MVPFHIISTVINFINLARFYIYIYIYMCVVTLKKKKKKKKVYNTYSGIKLQQN